MKQIARIRRTVEEMSQMVLYCMGGGVSWLFTTC